MGTKDGSATEERIAVTPGCRDMIRQKKRGGETFDSVLRKMVSRYDVKQDVAGSKTGS
ncbi:hypothetical protein [Halogranum rubrum]|uniref:Uncharacterized protein n=1 Tax=Halogranum salarium B-1 TaxID=1210908 RepID=J3A4Q8_9EURY|nr:hypothetical protein [Halogranum salarium]EJN60458.1 hypothetical protein HSB1_10610 [Halogranum salarium B-1]